MSEAQTFTGGCHCGQVRYQAELDLSTPVISCNCSMCGRVGSLLTFVTAEKFRLLAGEDQLTNYQFNKKQIDHLFCRTCGIKSFARGVRPDGKSMVAVNTRCLDDVDVGQLKVTQYDGKSL